jgi:hypothetical protein
MCDAFRLTARSNRFFFPAPCSLANEQNRHQNFTDLHFPDLQVTPSRSHFAPTANIPF